MAADLTIKAGDTLPAFSQILTDNNGYTLDLTGATVQFIMRLVSAATPVIDTTCTVTDPTAGMVQYNWSTTDTLVPGYYSCLFRVTNSDTSTITCPNDGYLEVLVEENLSTTGGQTLVSLGEARDYLNFLSTDKARDAKLLRFIRSVTPIVESITGPILQSTYDEWHDGGQVFFMAKRRPSVTYGTTAIFQIQACSEYAGPIEWPLAIISSPDQGQLYSVMADPDMPGKIVRRIVGGGVQAFPNMPQSIHVVYTAGQTTVPENVREGTLELIRLHFQYTQQGRARPGGGGGGYVDDQGPGREILGFFVPNAVRELLVPNRRFPSLA